MKRTLRLLPLLCVLSLAVPLSAWPASDATAQSSKKKKKRKRRRRAKRRAQKRAAEQQADAAVAEESVEEEAEEVSGDSSSAPAPEGTSGNVRRSNRMEFDARLVKGEAAGSGAVILFDRGARKLPPLTHKRSRFLDASLRPVLGPRHSQERPAPEIAASTEADKPENEPESKPEPKAEKAEP